MDAYYSKELMCWVRLEREADGEWCHTSGYITRGEAMGFEKPQHKNPLFGVFGMPSFLEENNDRQG